MQNLPKHIYFFMSMHREMFHGIAERLQHWHGVERFSAFVWGRRDAMALQDRAFEYSPLIQFTRDVLPLAHRRAPDLETLSRLEHRYGTGLHRMLFAERHLTEDLSYEELVALADGLFELLERTWDADRPDAIVTEDVSCLCSYVHYAVARAKGIPFFAIGQGKLRGTCAIYDNHLQRWSETDAVFARLRETGLSEQQRSEAAAWLEAFRRAPTRQKGQANVGQLPVASGADYGRFARTTLDWLKDPKDPTQKSPAWMLQRRVSRLLHERATRELFEVPPEGEAFVLFPLHFQPEASTLVRAPYYLDQPALIHDIALSLPAGVRLYVKEHYANRGRRSREYYQRIRNTVGVRLIGPDLPSWPLIQSCRGVAVITGTMGWEALLYRKPVVTFGDVFYNSYPEVLCAKHVAKEDWAGLFAKALGEDRRDDELLLAYVSAVLQTLQPGFKGNPGKYPEVLEPENLDQLTRALVRYMKLAPAA